MKHFNHSLGQEFDCHSMLFSSVRGHSLVGLLMLWSLSCFIHLTSVGLLLLSESLIIVKPNFLINEASVYCTGFCYIHTKNVVMQVVMLMSTDNSCTQI